MSIFNQLKIENQKLKMSCMAAATAPGIGAQQANF
jgi:hypothetical protein